MKLKVIVERFKVEDNYSLGKCYIQIDNVKHYIGCSLERGWQDNKKNISCVPAGEYKLKHEYSGKFKKKLWELYGVPGRSECKFHVANFWRQLNGCIALGYKHIDIDGDGDPDVTNSGIVMEIFHKIMRIALDNKVKVKVLIVDI